MLSAEERACFKCGKSKSDGKVVTEENKETIEKEFSNKGDAAAAPEAAPVAATEPATDGEGDVLVTDAVENNERADD